MSISAALASRTGDVDIWNSISSWSPGIAFGMACLYFFNFIVTKFLEEKAEWNATLEKMINRYDARLVETTTAHVNSANQDHQLRGKIQESMTRGETQYMTIIEMLRSIDSRLRGGGND